VKKRSGAPAGDELDRQRGRRAARQPGTGRGRSWTKHRRWFSPNDPAAPPRVEPLTRLKAHVDQASDAAALVEAVRLSRDLAIPPAAWIVDGLEKLLVNVVATAMPKRLRPASPVRSALRKWAKKYVRAYSDSIILGHVQSMHDEYGLTWMEACDEASCSFRGTRLEFSPDGIKKACKRARANERTGRRNRADTRFEHYTLHDYLCPLRGPSDWWIVNSDRTGNSRGDWAERPRLLARLAPAALAAEVRKREEEWDLKWKQSRPHT
jgi:hypothetical protein